MLDQIVHEMQRIGFWRDEPLPPEAYKFKAAFAMDTMPFPWWLQFIFVPRVREIIAARGAFPSSSMVGAQAVREFDGLEEASELVSLLSQFDALIKGAGGS